MTRLRVEFTSFYILFPAVLAIALPPAALFPGLLAFTLLGLVLLGRTPGFHWSELARGVGRIGWALVFGFGLATAVVALALVQLTEPAALFILPREMPWLMLAIGVLYPALSALPQEIVFRPLFFRRYGALLPADPRMQIAVNATVFSAAHLMYWSWVVAAMTFAGGVAFAWSYRVRGNFPEAVVLHSLAGLIVFGIGLGMFFYSGNIVRPF